MGKGFLSKEYALSSSHEGWDFLRYEPVPEEAPIACTSKDGTDTGPSNSTPARYFYEYIFFSFEAEPLT